MKVHVTRLPFRPPYHWNGLLSFLAPRATPGVEEVAAGAYRRSISLNGSRGFFEISLDQRQDSLLARVQFSDPRRRPFIVERIRAMFDLDADWPAIACTLRKDPMLAARIDATPGLRLPGCWNGFELAVRAILGQQVTVKAATVLAGRLATSFGRPIPAANGLTHLFPTPAILADAATAITGMPRARAETIRALSRAVADRRIQFEGVVDKQTFLTQLCEIPGIGPWTAQYVAMRALRDPDAFPSSDLGLLRALALTDPRELAKRAETWRPFRAYAAMYLWSTLASTNS